MTPDTKILALSTANNLFCCLVRHPGARCSRQRAFVSQLSNWRRLTGSRTEEHEANVCLRDLASHTIMLDREASSMNRMSSFNSSHLINCRPNVFVAHSSLSLHVCHRGYLRYATALAPRRCRANQWFSGSPY